jgi:hypothetical protein
MRPTRYTTDLMDPTLIRGPAALFLAFARPSYRRHTLFASEAYPIRCRTPEEADLSKDLGEKIADPHRHQYRGDGPFTDELGQLIRCVISPIYVPLNRLARVRDGPLCSITHTALQLCFIWPGNLPATSDRRVTGSVPGHGGTIHREPDGRSRPYREERSSTLCCALAWRQEDWVAREFESPAPEATTRLPGRGRSQNQNWESRASL